MKSIIEAYRKFFDIEDDIPDGAIIFRIIIFALGFLIAGILLNSLMERLFSLYN